MATIELFATVTKDPEIRWSASGNPWLTANLAENRKAKDGTETTTWWKLKMFGAQAEQLADQLRKGARLKVRGFFGTEEWTGNDGAKRTDLQVFPFADGVEVQDAPKHVGGQSFARTTAGYARTPDPWETATGVRNDSEPPF